MKVYRVHWRRPFAGRYNERMECHEGETGVNFIPCNSAATARKLMKQAFDDEVIVSKVLLVYEN